LYLLFALFPLYWLLRVSVSPNKLLYTEGTRLWPSRITWDNYAFVLTQSDFPGFFLNSVSVALTTGILVTLLASAAGYAFSRFRFRGRVLLMFVLLLTQMFPLVMIVAPIYRIMAPLGLVDNLWGLIIVYTAFNTPFATFLMQSFFDGIPRDLEEAAMIDGCTRFGALRRVVFPLTLPGMAATLGFVFTAAWSELLLALMLINSDDSSTFPVGLLNFISKFSVAWGHMMAAGVLALIPACVFFVMIQRFLVQG
jgi:multiple sugar transport system permease protein